MLFLTIFGELPFAVDEWENETVEKMINSIGVLKHQEMQEGFTYLETGKYTEAKSFFENVLKQFPTNRTARLCYGRAVGLSGDSAQAISIFTNLLTEYPNDFEIKLNYAESLLWNKQFNKAETFYEKLVVEQSSNFAGVLGYANTLSNLKKYPKALDWVQKALLINPGNANALLSQKYIRLGYAFSLSQKKEYQKALQLLDQNLKDFPTDTEILLNKANVFLIMNQYGKAKQAYIDIAKTAKDSIIALNGLALVSHKQNKNKQALQFAETSKAKVIAYKSDTNLWLSTQERYVQALLWNRKFSVAKFKIKELNAIFPDENRIISLEATLGMYTSSFKTSLERYSNILDTENDSFDGNLGIANAYRATGLDMKAYQYAFKTLRYYPKQTDAEKLIKDLKKSHTPFIEQKTFFTFDNGNNEAVSLSLLSQVPFSTRVKGTLKYTYRTTQNTLTNIEASSHDIAAGFHYKLNHRLSLLSDIGINRASSFTVSYTQITGQAIAQLKLLKLQNIQLGYKRELQNFNATLIDRELVMNNYIVTHNLGTNFNLGWYTQYMHTKQSDDNTRNLLFSSLYYSFWQKPVVKAGINYQYIRFQNQVPTIYFSPDQFHLTEVFAEVVSDPNKQWFYNVSAALGRQYVENDPASSTFRTEAKIGCRFSDRFMGNIYGKYSNIASATAAGFEFTEVGFKLQWYFLSQPIFNKKILVLKP